MITRTEKLLLICIVVSTSCIGAQKTDPNDLMPSVFFNMGQPEKHELELLPIKPKYAATFELRWLCSEPNDPNATELLKTVAGSSVSERQRKLIQSEKAISVKHSTIGGPTSRSLREGRKRYLLYAVTEEDTKRTVRALIEYWAEVGAIQALRMKKSHIENLMEKQEQFQEQLNKDEEEQKHISNRLPTAYSQYKEAVENSQYSTHPTDSVHEEVRNTIFEMDKMLDLINIEIIGIQSKLAAIKKHSDENKKLSRGTIVMMLDELAVRQEIELVGAESRRQAIMSVKKREEALYQQYQTLSDLKDKNESLKGSILSKRRNLGSMKRELSEIEKRYSGKWPFVISDEVRIRSIKSN